MRLLFVVSAHPKLEKCGEWYMTEQFINVNKDRGWFYVVIPRDAVPTCGMKRLPNTTLLRSRSDNSFHFMRDVGSHFSVNDGQYVVDACTVLTPQLAVGVDLQCNQHSFHNSPYDFPISIWQPMFWAIKSAKWRNSCTFYDNLFLSKNDEDVYRKFLLGRYKPSHVRKLMERSTILTYGVRLEELNSLAQKAEKYERPTIIFGGRQNPVHSPVPVMEMLRKFYMTGNDFDLIVTTPDNSVMPEVQEIVDELDGKIVTSCGQDEFFGYITKAHVAITSGMATSPTFAAEYLSAGTIAIVERTQWMDEIDHLAKGYPYVYDDYRQAYSYLKTIWKDLDKSYAKFNEGNWFEKIKSFDLGVKHRETFDYFRTLVTPFQRREKGGIGGMRTKRVLGQLATLGGEATLDDIIGVVELSGGIIRGECVGRWLTKKLLHDHLISHPAVVDLCDGPVPKYKLDYEVYREWLKNVVVEPEEEVIDWGGEETGISASL